MGLFERRLETDVLRRELDKLHEAGRTVTVTGEAGSGKTTLLTAVLGPEESHSPPPQSRVGPRVLRGLCDPLGTPRPLGPIREILAGRGASEPGIVAGTATIETELLEFAAREPTVLIIEDAQWVDAGSVEVLRFLIRRIDRLPVLLILTYRDTDVAFGHPLLPLLGDIARSEHSTHLALRPLSIDAIRDVLGVDGPDPVRVLALTGGNPFFVTEIARHPDEALPRTVRDAVIASTFGLDTADIEALQLVAAAPDALDDRLLPALAMDLPTLRRLESTGLLLRTRRGIAFRHELARLAIAGSTPIATERRLHDAILGALERIGSTDYAVLTHHAVGADDSDRTLWYARLAAQDATRTGSHSEAVAFLTTALDQLAADSVERAELLTRLSAEQYMISRLSDARESARESLVIRERLGDPDGIAAAHDRQAIIEYYAARRQEAEAQADLAAQAGAGAAAEASAQATRAYLAYRRQDVGEARAIAAEARELIDAADDRTDAARRRIAITEAAADLLEGSVPSRARLLAEAAGALQVSLDEIGTTAYSNLSALDVEHRRLTEAEGVLAESIPVTIARDIPICNQWQTGMRARLHFLRGRWTASGEDAAAVIDGHGAPLALIWPLVLSALLGLRRGSDPTSVDRNLELARTHAFELGEPLMQLAVLSAYAERAWLTGDRHPALDDTAAIVAKADRMPGSAWAIGDLLVWLARTGDEPIAAHVAEPHRLELEGRHGEAAEAWLALGAPFDSALAGVHDHAPVAAAEALARLLQLDVERSAARARGMLMERGVHSLPAPVRRATRSNPAGLTNRQLDVARLVAQGLTNGELAERLYISPKTADHHVSAVLGKLGLRSRREVVRSARELGLT